MLLINTNYYIYKYINTENNKIFYIGQTINLESRIKDHSIEKKFLPYAEHQEIYFISVASKEEMDFYEAYLIAKYKPELNGNFVGHSISLNVNEPEWRSYDEYFKEKENKQNELADRRKKLFINMMLSSYEKQLGECDGNIDKLTRAFSFTLSFINSAIPGIVKYETPENLNEIINGIDTYVTLAFKSEEKIEEIKECVCSLCNVSFINDSVNLSLIKEIEKKEENVEIKIHALGLAHLTDITKRNYEQMHEGLICEKEKIEEKIKEINTGEI